MKKLTKEEIIRRIEEIKSTMTFPRLSREEKMSCKLTDADIGAIRLLKSEGFSASAIGEMYGVSYWTVYYWTSEKLRTNALARNLKLIKYKYKNDPEFRKIYIKRNIEYRKRRNKNSQEYRKYVSDAVRLDYFKKALKKLKE